ncbi:Hypothetical protein TPENAI_P0003 [Tenacibaculum litopenaei]|uniref:hypothetical protein n=1 Tax=Tenacibaculum litopenaei TaxID=396016 RepID=UPI003893F2BA
MEPTIDKKVTDVIERENQKLSAEQRNYQKVVSDIEKITGNQSDNYIIAPKDTIGKSVRFNIGRR